MMLIYLALILIGLAALFYQSAVILISWEFWAFLVTGLLIYWMGWWSVPFVIGLWVLIGTVLDN
jgi:hypothetical protein